MGAFRRAATADDIDRVLRDLALRRDDWVGLGLRERADFLYACIAGVRGVACDWAHAACYAQGVDPSWIIAGDLWVSGPFVTLRTLRLLADAMQQDARPRPPAIRERGNQQIVTVTPNGLLDRAAMIGIDAEVWLEPDRPFSQGRIYRAKEAGEAGPGGVALVLGAGNIASIAARDLLHKLFVDDEVVVLKMHPVNEYLGPIFERAFAPLIDAGYLAIVYGEVETGRLLCRHELVDSIHLTGSHHTHDAIVWGDTEEERERRRAANDPIITKPVSSELGCVSPVIVVPGNWSDADVDLQARSVAGMIVNNASFNCNAAKVVVLQEGWRQREQFVDRLRAALAAVPQRFAYYPGAEDRYARFVGDYAQAEALGPEPSPGFLPWTLVPGVAPAKGEYGLSEEAFCGVAVETALPSADAGAFLRAATAFVNDCVWGQLTCMLLIDPATESALGPQLDEAVAELRYGGVAVNAWSGHLFALAAPSWGAFPGNTLADIGSGIGMVGGNTFLLDYPQKSVVRASFRAWPKPLWFPDHRSLRTLGRRLVAFQAAPGWRRLAGVALAAARG